MAALAGDDDNPAVAGLRPRRLGRALHDQRRRDRRRLPRFGTLAYTVELDGGTGPAVGGTDGTIPTPTRPAASSSRTPRRTSQAEFQKNLAFALDLARSANDPANLKSHLGNTAPDFVPTTFPISYGDPQTVEVNAKRELGAVTAALAGQRRP